MNKTVKTLAGAAIVGTALAAAGAAFAAEPILGNWRTQSGETAAISKCGSSFCVTLKTGKYAGKRIGKMKGKGGKYSGNITDPAANKTYSGRAKAKGSSLNMTGCVAKIFCKTQKWKKI